MVSIIYHLEDQHHFQSPDFCIVHVYFARLINCVWIGADWYTVERVLYLILSAIIGIYLLVSLEDWSSTGVAFQKAHY